MDRLLQRVDGLISQGRELLEEWRDEHGKSDEERAARAGRTARWVQSCEHFLGYVGLEEHKKNFITTKDSRAYAVYRFTQLVGLVESARDEIAAGYLGRLVHLVHADLFDSVLDQADELLRLGHATPAAVLIRIVIETWLRDEAQRNGIADYTSAKASVLNDKLKGVGVVSTPKWRLIQGYLDVGNAAAHGKTSEFSPEDVSQALVFTRANCL